MPKPAPARPVKTARLPFPLLLLLGLLAPLLACSAPAPLPRLLPPGERVPVVLVPGISGSLLADASTGEVVWGRGTNLVHPYDHGHALAQSLLGPSTLVPAGVIESMHLFRLIHKPIYGPVAEVLEVNGWVRGDRKAPTARENLYLFDYDWRQDNVESARELAALLESIVAATGRREVDLICQSNGAHVCRWALKYAGLSLEQAEAGVEAKPGFKVRRMVLVGTSNGGSLRILREMHRGRSYVTLIGRRIEPEVLFSLPSIYQELPFYHRKPFLDEEGKALPVDLYDAEVWQKNGLSIFGKEARKRADRRPDLFGAETQRRSFLEHALDHAERFHVQLGRDVELGAVRIFSIQNSYEPTPHAVVLRRGRKGEVELLFTGDAELEKLPYLKALAAAPGDGHATVESQQFLAPKEKAALAAPPYFVSGPHFELIIDPGALHRLVDFLSLPPRD